MMNPQVMRHIVDEIVQGQLRVQPLLSDDCYQGVAGFAAAGDQRQRWSVQRVAVDDTVGWIRACDVADLKKTVAIFSRGNQL